MQVLAATSFEFILDVSNLLTDGLSLVQRPFAVRSEIKLKMKYLDGAYCQHTLHRLNWF